MRRESHRASASGTYALILHVPVGPQSIQVGALGRLTLPSGYYCYVGSALRGLHARVARHFRTQNKRAHWHIDYLREAAEALGAIVWLTNERAECTLSRLVGRLCDASVPGFGASDCGCGSHLYRFEADPTGILMKLELGGTTACLLPPTGLLEPSPPAYQK